MSNGKVELLDESRRREVLAFLMLGSSRKQAAKYAGCSLASIQRTERTDCDFAMRLRKAESRVEADCLKSLHQAVTQEQQWRAATWLLERLNPEMFGKRNPRSVSVQECTQLFLALSELITRQVPSRYRSKVLKELDRMIKELETPNELDSSKGLGERSEE